LLENLGGIVAVFATVSTFFHCEHHIATSQLYRDDVDLHTIQSLRRRFARRAISVDANAGAAIAASSNLHAPALHALMDRYFPVS
jgi:hypothetical protein